MHQPITDIAIYTDPNNRFGRTIDRVARARRGRMPRPAERDAIALNDLAADLLHVGPGAVLTARRPGARRISMPCSPANGGFPGFHGPRLRLPVVGVVRTLDGLTANVERTSPYAFASSRLHRRTPRHRGVAGGGVRRDAWGRRGLSAPRPLPRERGPHSTGAPATESTDRRAAGRRRLRHRARDLRDRRRGSPARSSSARRSSVISSSARTGLRQLVDLGMTRTQIAIVAASHSSARRWSARVARRRSPRRCCRRCCPSGSPAAPSRARYPGRRGRSSAVTGTGAIVLFAGFTLLAGRS